MNVRRVNFLTLFWGVVVFGLLLATTATAQKRKTTKKKKTTTGITIKKVEPIALVVGVGGITVPIEITPYLSLEPCAKETPEQISELENAADEKKQLEILLNRINETDDWLRACAIYRLGEFRREASEALPTIIKLLRDEKNDSVWTHVESALWKVPPNANIPLAERIEMSKNENVYLRIYGIYSLGYFKPVAGSFQAKETLQALTEAVKDEDLTASWLAVMGIRQLGFYGIDTSGAIPALSEAIKNGKMNPVNPVRAFVPMGENALPAAPLLFDILYNPKKYARDKNEDNVRSYSLYLTAAIALGRIGKPIIPLLEKEIEKQPIAILQVLGNVAADGTLPIFFKAMKHKDPEVRKKAIESLPSLTSIGAVETLPHLLTAMRDTNLDVRKAAISKIGSIAKFTTEKSAALKEMLVKEAMPALMANLKSDETSCYAAMTLGDFGVDGEAAIPALANLTKKGRGDYCAELALFDLGEKGRKFLTKEQISRIEKSRKDDLKIFNPNYYKAKPIKPKIQPTPTPLKKES